MPPLLFGFLAAPFDVSDVAMFFNDAQGRIAAVTRIGAQVLAASLRRRGSLHHDGLKDCSNLADIMSICSGHDDRERDATTVHQQMTLAPIFSPDPSGSPDGFLCQRRLHHCAVDTLPSPRNALQIIVLRQSGFPQSFEYAGLLPLQKALVNCARTAEAFGRERLSLATSAQYINNGLEYQACLFGFAPRAGFAHIIPGPLTLAPGNPRLHPLPKRV